MGMGRERRGLVRLGLRARLGGWDRGPDLSGVGPGVDPADRPRAAGRSFLGPLREPAGPGSAKADGWLCSAAGPGTGCGSRRTLFLDHPGRRLYRSEKPANEREYQGRGRERGGAARYLGPAGRGLEAWLLARGAGGLPNGMCAVMHAQ